MITVMQNPTFRKNIERIAKVIKEDGPKWSINVIDGVSALTVSANIEGKTHPIGFTDQTGVKEVLRVLTEAYESDPDRKKLTGPRIMIFDDVVGDIIDRLPEIGSVKGNADNMREKCRDECMVFTLTRGMQDNTGAVYIISIDNFDRTECFNIDGAQGANHLLKCCMEAYRYVDTTGEI
jgi:hypothetical protein